MIELSYYNLRNSVDLSKHAHFNLSKLYKALSLNSLAIIRTSTKHLFQKQSSPSE